MNVACKCNTSHHTDESDESGEGGYYFTATSTGMIDESAVPTNIVLLRELPLQKRQQPDLWESGTLWSGQSSENPNPDILSVGITGISRYLTMAPRRLFSTLSRLEHYH